MNDKLLSIMITGDNMDKLKVLQNTTSNRILQVLYLNGTQTTLEIQKQLSDIPQATLYRYMKYLEQFQIIDVVKREKVYGQIEKTYAIRQLSVEESSSPEEALVSVDLFLKQIRSKYDRYFSEGNNSPLQDMLFMNSISLCLSDEEFAEMQEEIKSVLQKYIGREHTKDRRIRSLYLLSAPEEELL